MAKIMLVEDDNNLREIYGARLLAEGHEIVTAKDGEEALAVAVKEKPELIISDVMMPKISGFDMLDILRNAPETKFTKVIMMTALSQTEDKARADSLGADRYLVKSQVTLEDVARVVKDVLEGKTEEESAPAVAATTVEATSDAPAEAPAPETQAPAVDNVPAPEATPPVVEAPAPEPVPAPTADTAPEVVAVTEPTAIPNPASPPADPTPVMDTTSPATQINVSTPDSTPASDPATSTPTDNATALPAEPTTPQINVQLPQMPAVQPATEPEKVAETPVTTPEEPAPTIGPNLMEALQQESDKQPIPFTSTTEPASVEPTVVNGVENTVLEPVSAPVSQEPDALSVTPQSDQPAEPLVKKGVIQPLNDLNTGPDLNALLDAEEKKAPVTNPPANTVITPAGTAPEVPPATNSTPASTNQHDIISL